MERERNHNIDLYYNDSRDGWVAHSLYIEVPFVGIFLFSSTILLQGGLTMQTQPCRTLLDDLLLNVQ